MLKDVCSSERPFGGITVLFGGDFQQTLPVVTKGTRPDIVHATIQRSPVWNDIHVLHLHENMRVQRHPDSLPFSQWLLDIGHGKSDGISFSVTHIPDSMLSQSENDLIESVYSSMTNKNPLPSPDYFRQRAILTTQNKQVHDLNYSILDRLPSVEQLYSSADSYSMDCPTLQETSNIPVEFLHSLNASGLPIAQLRLKVGCPVILLRNIDARRGLCNGTRGTIVSMGHHLLEIRLIGGDHDGETTLIPRITLSPSLTGLDFSIQLNCRQFPIQLAFALTIHKSQGQTLQQIGVNLQKPVFTHGQLYVALSRATSPDNIKILLPESSHSKDSDNVVYQEVLLD